MDVMTGASFIAAGLVQAAISVGLFVWGQAVASHRRSRIWWWVSFAPLVALLLATAGVIGTVVSLVFAFDAVADVDPADKARALADGISGAMWFTAVAIPAWGVYLASIIAFAVGSLLPVPELPAAPESRIPAPRPPLPPA